MADDIDIEEHDLLDNPRLKNIFPDITSIKTEVIEYEEEGNGDDENFTLNYEDDEPMETEEPNFQNKIILGSKPCSSSASSVTTPEPKLQETSIVIKECGLHLEDNPCYCHECKILFPTENALDSHKNTVHSYLVAVRKNKAYKSTTKGSIFNRKIKIEPDPEEKSVLCSHCNEVFPDETALIRHSYELLPICFKCDLCDLDFESEAAFRAHQSTHTLNDKYVCCPICTCHFRSKVKLLSHMRTYHKLDDESLTPTEAVDFGCVTCGAKLPDCKRYNYHIQHKHPEMYNKYADNERYKCLPSVKLEKIHETPGDSDSSSKHEDEPMPSTSAESHSALVTMPISTLFKCTKCHVHFLSFTKAVEHFKTCKSVKGDYKCKICRRFLHKPDRACHLKQHELVDKFKGIKIRDDYIADTIICHCRNCLVCYDEISFLKCHQADCKPDRVVKCPHCRYIIHEDYMPQHSKAHLTGVRTNYFIVVDYMCYDPNERRELDAKIPKMDRTAKPKHLFYCPTCKCYLKINRTAHGHSVGKCNKTLKKYLCKLCGLCFTVKGMKTHKREHKAFPNLKLREFKFVNAQSGRRVDPRFPEFKKCRDCCVHFFSDQARKRHSCFTEVHKTCGYCDEKFSDLAFKLHVPFHKYAKGAKSIQPNIPEILKTYESLQTTWNILFLCDTCDVVIDSYDAVVEHCQDHYCNMESYNITISNCDICDLNFVGNSFHRHKGLHAENDLNKSSFIILKYNYEKLLTKAWSETFASLAKEQVYQILSRSIYQVTRSVRMEIAADGPLHSTLYKCEACNAIVDSTSVEEHAQSNTCANLRAKHHCSQCKLRFLTRTSKLEHVLLHETRKLNSDSYRIIAFNSQKDWYVNDVLRSKLRPEGLHFKRCQQCGKLIQKDKFHKHYTQHIHDQKLKMKTAMNRTKLLSKPKSSKTAHTFYTCRKCKASVPFRQAANVHTCRRSAKLSKCVKCGLMIRSTSMHSHGQYHRRYPKMTQSDIKIVYFHHKGVENTIVERTENDELIFYQCEDCSMAVHRESTVKKHSCSTKANKKHCNICELSFHASHYMYHDKLHEQISFSRSDTVIIGFKDGVILNTKPQIKATRKSGREEKIYTQKIPRRSPFGSQINYELSERDFYRSMSVRLYKCHTCKLLFITGSGLVHHQKSCREDNTGVECKDCGLIFHESMIKYHINLQKCNFKAQINFVSLKMNGLVYQDKNVVYLCRQCNVYNISLRGIMYHIDANHKIGMTTIKCTTCDIIFSSVSYRKHKKVHHTKKNMGFKDLTVATVDIMSLEDALKDLPDRNEIRLVDIESIEDTVENIRPLKRKLSGDDEESQEDEEIEQDKPQSIKIRSEQTITPKSKVAFDKGSLFKCEICDLNFLHPKSIKRHMDIGRHDEQRYNCPECNLLFTRISLTRHMHSHERLEKSSDYSPRYRNGPRRARRSQGDQSEESSYSSSTVKVEVEVDWSPLIRNQEQNRLTQRTVERNRVEQRTVELNNDNTEVKLYKCGVCDVYYLRQDICHDHITDHAPLDPTEYIACKMCELQFPCEYLGSHMKTHRDQSFNIDKLIVTEYQVGDSGVRVDTYSAADRLKSKLVSTTTHFDTEDEKNDNIDSTTLDSFDGSNFNQSAGVNIDQSVDRSSQVNSPMDVES